MTTTPARDPEVAQFARQLGDGDWRYAGEVGVDSGQLVLCDPCYINSQWSHESFYELDGTDARTGASFSYPTCCGITSRKPHYGQLHYNLGHSGVGVVFASGYGDGAYPVFVRLNEEQRIVEMRVLMDWEDEDGDEDPAA